MSKIYSRPRLKIPKFVFYKKNEKIRSKKRTKLILIIFIAFITVKTVLDAVIPIFNTSCENKAISIATVVSNAKATEVMSDYTYDDLFSIQKDEKGNVSMLKANVVPINKITSDVAMKIQDEINKEGKEDIEIPLRKFYWIKITFRPWTWNQNKNFFGRKCKNRFKK